MFGWFRKDESKAAGAEAALAALFETGTVGIAEVDLLAGKYLRVNRRCCEILERDAQTLLHMAPGDVIPPQERARILNECAIALRDTGRWEAELRHIDPQGRERWARVGVSVSKRDANGRAIRCVAVLQDVTQSRDVAERLRRSEELLRLGQRIGRIGTFERDLVTGKLYSSAETRLMFGLTAEARLIGGEQWLPCFLAQDRQRIDETIRAALARGDEEIAVEASMHRFGDGALRHLEMRARYFYDENRRPLRSVGVIIDVTERRQAEQRLAHAARHDSLTGLGNRALFREALAEAAAQGAPFAVLCIDLDRFKQVNDTFGHPAGDRLLIEMAARLGAALRGGEILARLGGDEFAILQPGVDDAQAASRLAQDIVARARAPFLIAGRGVDVGASVGVALAPRDGRDGDDLLVAADLALYRAKAEGGWRLFEPQMRRGETSRELGAAA